MKKALWIVMALLVASTAAVAQEKKIERKVIVKDGKVWTSENGGPLVPHASFLRGGYLGVQTMNLNPQLREHFGAPKDAGVLVSEVSPDSPAAKAGLRVGDIITSVDSELIQSQFELRRVIVKKKANDPAKIGFVRKGGNQVAHASIVEGQRPMIDVDAFVDPGVIEGITAEAASDVAKYFESPEWKAQMEQIRHRSKEMQSRSKELQQRLEELEQRLREMEQKLKK